MLYSEAESDEESETAETEDEILVVELSGVPNPDAVLQSSGPCSILGLDTSEPVLQLENYVFKGRYEDSLGTCLIFRESGKELKYECSTNKKLCMSRVLLKKKTALQDNSTENNTTHKAT